MKPLLCETLQELRSFFALNDHYHYLFVFYIIILRDRKSKNNNFACKITRLGYSGCVNRYISRNCLEQYFVENVSLRGRNLILLLFLYTFFLCRQHFPEKRLHKYSAKKFYGQRERRNVSSFEKFSRPTTKIRMFPKFFQNTIVHFRHLEGAPFNLRSNKGKDVRLSRRTRCFQFQRERRRNWRPSSRSFSFSLSLSAPPL